MQIPSSHLLGGSYDVVEEILARVERELGVRFSENRLSLALALTPNGILKADTGCRERKALVTNGHLHVATAIQKALEARSANMKTRQALERRERLAGIAVELGCPQEGRCPSEREGFAATCIHAIAGATVEECGLPDAYGPLDRLLVKNRTDSDRLMHIGDPIRTLMDMTDEALYTRELQFQTQSDAGERRVMSVSSYGIELGTGEGVNWRNAKWNAVMNAIENESTWRQEVLSIYG